MLKNLFFLEYILINSNNVFQLELFLIRLSLDIDSLSIDMSGRKNVARTLQVVFRQKKKLNIECHSSKF